jgi:hypothetical protein
MAAPDGDRRIMAGIEHGHVAAGEAGVLTGRSLRRGKAAAQAQKNARNYNDSVHVGMAYGIFDAFLTFGQSSAVTWLWCPSTYATHRFPSLSGFAS